MLDKLVALHLFAHLFQPSST